MIDHLFDVPRHQDRVDLAAILPTVNWRQTTNPLAPTVALTDSGAQRVPVPKLDFAQHALSYTSTSDPPCAEVRSADSAATSCARDRTPNSR